jgi:hypothetical protein
MAIGALERPSRNTWAALEIKRLKSYLTGKESEMKKIAWLVVLGCSWAVALAAAPPTIKLLSPQGGENWALGTNHPIVWSTVSGISGTLFINLWGYNKANQLIHLGTIAEANYRQGSFLWNAGSYAGKMAGVGNYHIRIRIWYTPQHFMEAWDQNPFRLVAFALPKSVEKR